MGPVRDAFLDLVLGSACLLCGTPGRVLCRRCDASLPSRAGPAWPTPVPAGLVRPASAGEYADALRTLVVEHKERTRLALAAPLGRLLAAAVLDADAAAGDGGRDTDLVLVPVPSHPAVVRARGHDPVRRMALAAAGRVRRSGRRARVVPLLGVLTRPEDQAGLGATARAENVSGRFRVRPHVGIGREGRPRVVLVDDVVTTGSTLREAQRALEAAGHGPIGSATVAATRRRRPPVPLPGPGSRG